MPYGTILAGQMFVQYLTPAQVRHPYPIVLVHGGGGSMLHYMGVGEQSGWAHHYVQEGYGSISSIDPVTAARRTIPTRSARSATTSPTPRSPPTRGGRRSGPNRQWPGTGDIGDPLLDQMLAGQNAAMGDNVAAQRLWASRGAELLDKIGPAIIQVHSAGGPFG